MKNNDDKENIVEQIDVKDYLQVILRRKWIILAFFIASVAISAIYTMKSIPIYRTKTQVLIGRENPNVVSIEEVVTPERGDLQWNQTQIKILSSRSLALRVIKALNLKDSPEFKPDEKRRNFSIRGLVGLLAGKVINTLKPQEEVYKSEGIKKRDIKRNDNPEFKPDVERRGFLSSLRGKIYYKLKSLKRKLDSKKEFLKSGKGDEDSRLIGSYLSRIDVEAIKFSRLVNISFEGIHPETITAMANRHAQEYIEQNHEMKLGTTKDAIEWLQEQLAEKEEGVEKAEIELQVYKEREKIVSLEDRQNIIVQKLADLNTALTKARTERIGLETFYNETKIFADNPDMIESIPYVMENALIQILKKEYMDTTSEISKLSGKYGEKFPSMIKLVSQAKELKSRISSEVNKLIKSIEAKYKMASSKEESLADALEEQKIVALNLNRKAIAYGSLKRESESEKAMYDILLNRMKETDIAGELRTSNVRIIDVAEVPKYPIKPNKRFNILLAAVIGLIMGVGIAFLLENFDKTVKSPDDVERYLGLSLLGAFEKVKDPKDKKVPSFNILTHRMPRSMIAEAFRNVRTNVMFTSVENPKRYKKLMLVTSVGEDEGKTFVVSNLGVAIAQSGKKTLIVDTDFHHPRLSKVFHVRNKPGLNELLIGEETLSSIIKPTKIPNLSIVTCGKIPHNPSEILGSDSMEKFCKDVRKQFDIVFFDTPPSMAVTDAIVLANILEGVIFVIKSGEHDRKVVERAISQITDKNHEILGIVMNHIDVSTGGYFHRYPYASYKYGYNGYIADNGYNGRGDRKSKKNAKKNAKKNGKKNGKTNARTDANTDADTDMGIMFDKK